VPEPTRSPRVRNFKLIPAAKKELAALDSAGRTALVAAMRRYEMDEHFAKEVKAMKKMAVTDSAGRKYSMYELRVRVGNNPYRLLFAHVGRSDQVCLGVTALYKNQQELPKEDRDRALERLKERVK
jgi:phage-related protein